MNIQKVKGKSVDLDALKDCIDLTMLFGVGKVLCPWHNDGSPSLQVYPDHVYCFSCGAIHDAIDYVMASKGMRFDEAVLWLYERQMTTARAKAEAPPDISLSRVSDEHDTLAGLGGNSFPRKYLYRRGVGGKTAESLNLGYNEQPFEGSSPGIAIPHLVNGKPENIKYRMLGGPVKYRALKGYSFKHLYPWDAFRSWHSTAKTLFLCESEFDAMLLLQEGLPAMGLCNGAGTDLQPFFPFFKRFETVYVLFDMDDAGNKAANKLLERDKSIGKSFIDMLSPTVVRRLKWPVAFGNDVTDARKFLIPKLRRLHGT